MVKQFPIPSKLVIQGQTYIVSTATEHELGVTTWADVEHCTNQIRIIDKAAPSRHIELLLHESLHAMLTFLRLDNEEAIVEDLGRNLTAFLRDNPKFIKDALAVLSQ